ncbi:TIR-like protein FxsC [Catenulispora rubra]|uniref:TIR-like protein FxsC n=1 Tax=Catenulispora rubra TaxID=280293 RepID=UPI001891FCCC|nr:TIR-like protein FxsC [Catenulispora rubra]
MAEEERERLAKAPYFFLSYARMPPHNDTGTSRGEADKDVIEFYQDLCIAIRHLAVVKPGAQAGYLDRAMGTATQWEVAVQEALATCRTFVALYKPAYFESSWCGREWAAFERRQQLARQAGSIAYDAIIPVLWADEGSLPDPLPKAAKPVQYEDAGQPSSYRLQGLWELRFGMYDHDYKRTTIAIARTILRIARSTQIPPCDITEFSQDDNAFSSVSE